MPPRVQREPCIENLVRIELWGILGVGQALLHSTAGADLVPRPISRDELGLGVVLLAQSAYWHESRSNQWRIVLQGCGLRPFSIVIKGIVQE